MRLKPNPKLHSKEHLLADDLSKMLSEPKRFRSYLGIAKLYYEEDLRVLARRILEKENLPRERRGRYFFAVLKNLSKKPPVLRKKKLKTLKLKLKKRK